jgi:hypothetical protein
MAIMMGFSTGIIYAFYVPENNGDVNLYQGLAWKAICIRFRILYNCSIRYNFFLTANRR